MGLGADNNGNTSMTGLIDDFAFFNGALSEEQIVQLAGGESPLSILVPPFRIVEYSRTGDVISLEWESNPGEVFSVRFSTDLADAEGADMDAFEGDLDDGIEANPDGNTTTLTFDLSTRELQDVPRMFFRVEK